MRDHGKATEVASSVRSTTVRLSCRSDTRSTSQMTKPPGLTSCAQRASRVATSPPMPTLPSISNAVPHRPSAGKGWLILRRSASPPRAMLSPTATEDMSTPSAARPDSLSACTMRPGPQPKSITGGSHRATTSMSTTSAAPDQRETSRGSGLSLSIPAGVMLLAINVPAYAASKKRSLVCKGRRLVISPYLREKSKPGNCVATRSASSGRSTSRSGGSSFTLRPELISRAS